MIITAHVAECYVCFPACVSFFWLFSFRQTEQRGKRRADNAQRKCRRLPESACEDSKQLEGHVGQKVDAEFKCAPSARVTSAMHKDDASTSSSAAIEGCSQATWGSNGRQTDDDDDDESISTVDSRVVEECSGAEVTPASPGFDQDFDQTSHLANDDESNQETAQTTQSFTDRGPITIVFERPGESGFLCSNLSCEEGWLKVEPAPGNVTITVSDDPGHLLLRTNLDASVAPTSTSRTPPQSFRESISEARGNEPVNTTDFLVPSVSKQFPALERYIRGITA